MTNPSDVAQHQIGSSGARRIAHACDPAQLIALAALASLREAVSWLDDVHDAATIPGEARQAATQTRRAIARAGTLYAVELAERRADQRITPAGATRMPIRPALLDAGAVAQAAVTDAAWIASSSLRRRPLLVYGLAWQVVYGSPWAGACAQLRAALPWTPAPVAREVGGTLDQADRYVRGVIGVGPSWIRIPGQACPRCERRSIEAEASSLDEREWIVRCEQGCLTSTVEAFGRDHGRLGDLLALIRSVRRQMGKRARRAA